MRRISVFILLFLGVMACAPALRAQPARSAGRERPRGEWRVYPTREEAAAAAATDNRYLRNLTEWSHEGETFSIPFTVPFSWINRQVYFHLDAASAAYELFVNGRQTATNNDPSLPAEFNITRWTHEGRNTIEIRLKKASETAPAESWRTDTEPQIGRAWVMTQPTLHIRDVVARTKRNETGAAIAEIGLVMKSGALNPRTSQIHYELLNPAGKRIVSGKQAITLDMRGEDTIRFLATLPDTLLWSPAHPVRCTLQLKTQHEGRYVEYIELPMGFREIAVDREGRMRLNGAETTLRGCEASPAITADAIAALREKGYNVLKLKAGSVRPGLYDDCDRAGMLVIAQAPIDTSESGPSRRKGGNPSNDPQWRTAFIERIEDSYHTSKRHPSVIAFSLAERSANGICLYDGYLAAKQFGDPRPFIYRDGGNEWNNDPLQMQMD